MAENTTVETEIADEDLEPVADETARQAQRVVAAYAEDARRVQDAALDARYLPRRQARLNLSLTDREGTTCLSVPDSTSSTLFLTAHPASSTGEAVSRAG